MRFRHVKSSPSIPKYYDYTSGYWHIVVQSSNDDDVEVVVVVVVVETHDKTRN